MNLRRRVGKVTRVGAKADSNYFLPSMFGRILLCLPHLDVLLYLEPSSLLGRLTTVGCIPTITLGFGVVMIHSRNDIVNRLAQILKKFRLFSRIQTLNISVGIARNIYSLVYAFMHLLVGPVPLMS